MSLATTYRTVALAAICVGCNTEPCTLIGCVGGLHIILPSDVDVNQAVHVEIELPDGSQQEQLCEVSSDCSEFFFEGVSARSVVLRITIGGNTTQILERELTYNEFRPNGPDCEPICRSARVHIK